MYETVGSVSIPEELQGKPAQRDVYVAVANSEALIRPSEIADKTGRSIDSVNGALSSLLEEGFLEKPEHGKYRMSENPDQEKQDSDDLDLQKVPEVEAGAGNDVLKEVNGGLQMPKQWIREAYGIRPDRLCVMRVRGDSMLNTLRPGQRLMAATWEGDEDLEDGVVYGLRGPLGFTVKRIRFDRKDGKPIIWVWSDNDEYADHRHWLTPEEFEGEYDVVAKALEVGKKL